MFAPQKKTMSRSSRSIALNLILIPLALRSVTLLHFCQPMQELRDYFRPARNYPRQIFICWYFLPGAAFDSGNDPSPLISSDLSNLPFLGSVLISVHQWQYLTPEAPFYVYTYSLWRVFQNENNSFIGNSFDLCILCHE